MRLQLAQFVDSSWSVLGNADVGHARVKLLTLEASLQKAFLMAL